MSNPSDPSSSTTTTTAKRQIWSSVSMSMHRRTSSSADADLPPQAKATSLPPPYTEIPRAPSANETSWRFEIALEGGSCVIKPTSPASSPTSGMLNCFKALFSIIAGSVMAFIGVIVSIVAVIVTYIFPTMAAKAPAPSSVPRPPLASQASTASSPTIASSTSSPSIRDRRILASSSDITLVSASSSTQRHVSFHLEKDAKPELSTSSSPIIALNTPVVPTFGAPLVSAPEEIIEEDDYAPLDLARAPSSDNTKKQRRRSWFSVKRRSATDSFVESYDSTSEQSAPATPVKPTMDLPAVSEEDGSGSGLEGRKEGKEKEKRGRRISLKLQFGGGRRKRSGSIDEEGMMEDVTPKSAPLGSQQVALSTKQQKRRSFPFVGASASQQQQQPQKPTARTNPYAAPYFATPPTARQGSGSSGEGVGVVSEMGEIVSTRTPMKATAPEQPKRTSPYAERRVPSSSPVNTTSGRVASDSKVTVPARAGSVERKRTSSSGASSRPPVVDRHARMREVWASDSEMVGSVKRGASVGRGSSNLRE